MRSLPGMRGLTRQQVAFVTKLVREVNRSAACGLGINALDAYALDRPSFFRPPHL
jgi:predicted TIM-barrel enzyme